MIRQMLRLAVEAVKVEIEHWRNPVQPEPVVAPIVTAAQVAPTVSKWSSSAFHMQVLASTECPDCGAPKKVHSYRCPSCTVIARKAAGYAT